MKKVLAFFESTSAKSILTKLTIVTALIFASFFVRPFIYVAFAVICLILLVEHNINSFYMLAYLLCFMSVLKFDGAQGFSAFNLSVFVFVAIQGVCYIIRVAKKQEKFNWKLLIPFALIAVYITIPFSSSYKFFNVAEAYVWLALFYLLLVNRKQLSYIKMMYVLIFGVLSSSFFGAFRGQIPFLQETIVIYSSGNIFRFPGLMSNPNMFYEICITAIALIFVLSYKKVIDPWNLIFVVPLTMIGICTISKTFLVCIYLLLAIVAIVLVIDLIRQKEILSTVGLLLCVVIGALIVFPYTKQLVGRVDTATVGEVSGIEQPFGGNQQPSENQPQIDGNPQQPVTPQQPTTPQQPANSQQPSDQSQIGGDQQQFDEVDGLLTGRMQIWVHYLTELFGNKKQLIFGGGIGSAVGYQGQNSHNGYIQILYEMGIIGTLLIFGCIIYILWQNKFSFKRFLTKLEFVPLLIMLAYYFTENQFMSQLGNLVLIISLFALFSNSNAEQTSQSKEKVENKNIEQKIPKVIHYIWLGGTPLPKLAEKCIASWKKFCPDYEIKRWDESNVNLDMCKYVRDAYDAKKYAFASDVIRFDVLSKEGGIYLDIDVELVRPLDDLLGSSCFMGFENSQYVAPGLILGACKDNAFISEIRSYYNNLKLDLTNPQKILTVCGIVTDALEKHGLVKNNETQTLNGDITIYSSDYFCPKSMSDGKTTITMNTYSIHHYLGSWSNPKYKLKNKVIWTVKRIIGEKNVQRIKALIHKESKNG